MQALASAFAGGAFRELDTLSLAGNKCCFAKGRLLDRPCLSIFSVALYENRLFDAVSAFSV